MSGIGHFVSKILVWLAVVLFPLQPLWAAWCCCATPREAEHDVQKQQAACGGNTCCSKETPAVPANSSGCGPQVACACLADNASLPAPQAPAPVERHGQTLMDLAQPLGAVALHLGESRDYPSLFSPNWPVVASGFERCIVLCRFIL